MDQTKLLAAQQTFTLEGPGLKVTNPVSQLEKIMSTTIGVLTLVAVIFFTIQIIFAGYTFISAQGDKEKIKSARKRLTDGILGLTIVVIAFGFGAFLAKLVGLGNVFDLNSIINLLAPQ